MTEIIDVGPECRERFLDAHQFPELAAADVWLAGLSDLRGWHRIERSLCGRAMLSFALEGGSYFRIGGHAGHVRGGEAIFVPPDTPFTLTLDDGGHRRSAWWIVQWTATWQGLATLPHHFAWADGPRFAAALDTLHAERSAPPLSRLRGLLVEQCCEYALRQARAHTAARRHDAAIEGVLAAVLADLARPWTLDALCLQAGLSHAQLHRRFVRHYGQSPMTRVADLRLQRAASMLTVGQERIAVVAEHVGYPNPFYFSTAFKARFGVAPSRFRAIQQGRGA